jgi:hypothetical protein
MPSNASVNLPLARIPAESQEREFVQDCLHAEQEFATHMRSFKCHNWAYAKPALIEVIEQMRRRSQ